MRVHRLIAILLLIESKKSIKAKEIASKLEISIRTVYRDIETLCEAGIPLSAATGPNGGIYLMEGYSCGISQLQEEDIISLYLSGMGILPDKGSGMAVKLNNTLLKLQNSLSPKQSSDLNNIKKKFYFDDTPWWGNSSQLLYADRLMQAVYQSKALRIKYKKHNGELSDRVLYPYGLIVKKTDWYLAGYCKKNKDIRTFKCDRITACDILEESFSMPVDFEIEAYWKQSQKVFKDLCADKEHYPVTIKFQKHRAGAVSDMEVFELQEEKDDLVAVINMYDYECAVRDVVKIIGFAEIINPAELRIIAAQELKKAMMKYTNE